MLRGAHSSLMSVCRGLSHILSLQWGRCIRSETADAEEQQGYTVGIMALQQGPQFELEAPKISRMHERETLTVFQ